MIVRYIGHNLSTTAPSFSTGSPVAKVGACWFVLIMLSLFNSIQFVNLPCSPLTIVSTHHTDHVIFYLLPTIPTTLSTSVLVLWEIYKSPRKFEIFYGLEFIRAQPDVNSSYTWYILSFTTDVVVVFRYIFYDSGNLLGVVWLTHQLDKPRKDVASCSNDGTSNNYFQTYIKQVSWFSSSLEVCLQLLLSFCPF